MGEGLILNEYNCDLTNIPLSINIKNKKQREFPIKICSEELKNKFKRLMNENQDEIFEEIRILAWNARGLNNAKEAIIDSIKQHKINTTILCETWSINDVNLFRNETNLNALREAGIAGRPSGGQFIGSNFPLYKPKCKDGMIKSIINGVFIIGIYFNDIGIANKQ